MKRIFIAVHRSVLLLLCMLLPVCASAETYYATSQGTYYHLDSHCQGMRNASPVFAEDAILAGKQACPVCIQ